MNPFNRRDFLKLSALSSIGIPNISYPKPSSKTVSKRYLLICLYGAPGRWYFDNPLRLNPKDPFLPNNMIVNGIDKNGRPQYMSQMWEQYNMPHGWF
jgi:hypothetical protein